MTDKQPRLGAAAVVFRDATKSDILLGKRAKGPNGFAQRKQVAQ